MLQLFSSTFPIPAFLRFIPLIDAPASGGFVRQSDLFRHRSLWIAILLLALCGAVQAQTTVLHLRNGDRIAGTIVSEDTNHVVITTTWTKELSVPVEEIERREIVGFGASTSKTTNAVSGFPPGAAMAVTAVPSPPGPKAKPWKVEVKVGADFLYGATDQQIYYGRGKLTYAHPYTAYPKEFFRNVLDYSVDYGRTEGVLSANSMDGSDKSDVDISRKFYIYNLLGVGYDEIRKIDLRYEVGPGLGYHLITESNLTMNLETGLDYQAQYRSDGTTTKNFFPRVAENAVWKINHRFTFSEAAEFFPPVQYEYRARLESNLAYALWQNLSLNLSVLDYYDSHPAEAVPNNDLQIRSSIGITF